MSTALIFSLVTLCVFGTSVGVVSGLMIRRGFWVTLKDIVVIDGMVGGCMAMAFVKVFNLVQNTQDYLKGLVVGMVIILVMRVALSKDKSNALVVAIVTPFAMAFLILIFGLIYTGLKQAGI